MMHNLFASTDNRRSRAAMTMLVACLWWQGIDCAQAATVQQPATTQALAAPALPSIFPGQIGTDYADCERIGASALAHGAYQVAADNYREAIKLKPNEAAPHLGLGRALNGIGLQEEALQEMFQALTLNNNLLDARFSIATIMMKRDSWDEAAGQFMQILKAAPDDLGARGNLAICYEQKGQLDSAIEQFKYIAQVNPKNVDAHYNLACAYDLKQDYEAAAAEYRQAIRLDPKHPLAYFGLANCLMNKKDYKSAIVVDQAAIKVHPENYYAYIGLGRAFECLGKDDEALKNYRKAIEIDPKAPECQHLMHNILKERAAKLGLRDIPGL